MSPWVNGPPAGSSSRSRSWRRSAEHLAAHVRAAVVEASPDARLDELGEWLRERVERAHLRLIREPGRWKLVIWKLPGASPKNMPQHGDVCGVEAVVPRDPLGIRRRDERRPGRVGCRVRRSRRPARRDRVPRPPEVEVVLVVPAVDRRVRPLRFCSARSLALSAASRSFRAMSCRATSFQLRPGALCHHLAMYVWSVGPGRAGRLCRGS